MYGVACAILMALLKVNSRSEEYSLGQEDKIIIVKNITECKKGQNPVGIYEQQIVEEK